MKKMILPAACLGVVCVIALGCGKPLFSRDIMYGPNGEIITMKSPDKTLKIKYKGDEVKIKGARGIGGRSRVQMPPVPVETDQGTVGVQGVMVAPPPGPVVPVVPAPAVHERSVETEQQTIVH